MLAQRCLHAQQLSGVRAGGPHSGSDDDRATVTLRISLHNHFIRLALRLCECNSFGRAPARGAVDTRRGLYTFSRDDVAGDVRNHNVDGHDRARCEAQRQPTHTRVREKARVRERVPDGLRPDVPPLDLVE